MNLRKMNFLKKFMNFIVMGLGFVVNFSLGLGREIEVSGGFGCGGGLFRSGFFRSCGVMPRAVVNSDLKFRRERTFPSFLSGIGKVGHVVLREVVCSAPDSATLQLSTTIEPACLPRFCPLLLGSAEIACCP